MPSVTTLLMKFCNHFKPSRANRFRGESLLSWPFQKGRQQGLVLLEFLKDYSNSLPRCEHCPACSDLPALPPLLALAPLCLLSRSGGCLLVRFCGAAVVAALLFPSLCSAPASRCTNLLVWFGMSSDLSACPLWETKSRPIRVPNRWALALRISEAKWKESGRAITPRSLLVLNHCMPRSVRTFSDLV